MNKESYGRLVGILSNEIARRFSANFFNDKLTGKQRRVMHYIMANYEHRHIFQRDIELEFNMRRSSASIMLANMEKAGVIQREPVSYDARLKRIVVTEEGQYIKNQVMRDCINMEERIIRGIPEADLEICGRVLKKMIENLKEEDKK